MIFFTIVKSRSERVPGKNFAPVGGKPLWRHTVDRFKEFPLYIDTDSEAVLESCGRGSLCSVTAYRRLPEHVKWERDAANRGSPVNAMLGRFMSEHVEDWDEPVVLFHVTSPFLRVESVISAMEYLKKGFASVQSVLEVQDFVWTGSREASEPLNFSPSRVVQTQNLPRLYVSRGAFFILTRRGFEETSVRDVEPRYLYPLGPLEGIDIDSQGDLEFARIIAGADTDEVN